MYSLSVFRTRNEGTPREKCFCRNYHFKTIKGLCRALRRFSWNNSYNYAKVVSDDFSFRDSVFFGDSFDQDFTHLKDRLILFYFFKECDF